MYNKFNLNMLTMQELIDVCKRMGQIVFIWVLGLVCGKMGGVGENPSPGQSNGYSKIEEKENKNEL